ncbi:MAG: tetratricopeptide repeat protein [Alphaproteobacteria bacterium]|nr:tetratricopeptide repeat protein [Alphaproteobacteria bacterium]
MRCLFAAALFLVVLADPASAQTRNENWALCEAGDPARGIAACTSLIESGSETIQNLAIAHSNRGITYSDKGDFARAIADYERALQLRPTLVSALNSLAWDLATMPQADRRDGRRAVELAEQAASSNPREPGFLDTLAAAYAEAGKFGDAVRSQKQGIEMLKQTEGMPKSVIDDFESRLRLYENNQPFHRSP